MHRHIFLFTFCMLTMFSIDAQDWANTSRYAHQNDSLAQIPNTGHRVVLMGNSITDDWVDFHPQFFTENQLIGRGVSGQTSSQMVARFRLDVLNLRPSVVVINAGTNDIAENTGPYNEELTMSNIVSMVELARLHRIQVVLTSVLPSDGFVWNTSITDAPAKIASLNERISRYAQDHAIPYVDYYKQMVVPATGALIAEFTYDGVHPTGAGYEVMEALLLPVVTQLR
ncbi:MAG: hypothetical protein IKH19_10190 [Muribaculaceae bacterium]|nr:hypothetical protein [Muribaculaceae bacterium]